MSVVPAIALAESYFCATLPAWSSVILLSTSRAATGLVTINPQNPVFLLTFCIFEKKAYRTAMVPLVQALKFEFWGHDGVVLHSREIRKSSADFSILLNQAVRDRFMATVNFVFEQAPVTLIAAAIDKLRHVQKYHVQTIHTKLR